MDLIITSVFSKSAFSPQYAAYSSIAYSHGGDWDKVCEWKIHNVVSVKSNDKLSEQKWFSIKSKMDIKQDEMNGTNFQGFSN